MLTKSQVIAAGFAMFGVTKLHRLVRPWTSGQGAILMFHHVRPSSERAFAPNRLLEITPEFLDAVLTRVKVLGFDIVPLEEALQRIGVINAHPFISLSFDDGYKDLVNHALPVLEQHNAPFTFYITSGFADRSAHLWWVELEEAIRQLPSISLRIRDQEFNEIAETPQQKSQVFEAVYRLLRAGPEEDLLAAVTQLTAQAQIDRRGLIESLCLDWDGVKALASHPLATAGVHTVTHPMLAKHELALVRQEIVESRRALEEKLGRQMHHLAYPVGDPTSAGPREFALAQELGFVSAVTTRPGMIFLEHDQYRTALPRVSINGNWQRLDAVEVLLSGAPFALWNRGRRVPAA